MSSNKFSRFLHLERSRGDKTPPGGQVRLQDGNRFESVAGPGETPASVSVPEAHVERFKLHGQTPLALDDTSAQAEHFPRCVRCQSENGRFTRECTTCGADLQASEQLAYNEERQHAQEQAELQLREQMEAVQKARQHTDAQRLAEQQRYMEQLHQALEKDRSFLSRLQPFVTPSIGVGLLRLIPHPLARWMTLAWAIGLPVLLVRFGNTPLRLLGLYLGVLVFLSFIPTSLLTAGRRW
ncbi:hypothetical protein [Vitiosangium sp. GDMCC 1.1324]|uniref:hypothetical protein n=1 Tax=Vitiosangium sp. (strain GDMCC 1.1324) TaxID=2138576 RepID=UPI000D3332FD|nr:hypothetical protein [Vitiosangium sp. GDMCC 1.1324]PTL84783.1 hypothetical protein DAT35_06900 [Vitiosangium sp. GDMCC 1.1324]